MTVYQYDLLLNENNIPQLKVVNEFIRPKAKYFSTPENVVGFMNATFDLNKKAEEYLYMIGFNNALVPVGVFEIAHGTVNQAAFSIREIMIRALACGACRILLIHNHPGINTEFSKEDNTFNSQMKNACQLLNVEFLDSIVVSGNKYRSSIDEREIECNDWI